MPLSVHKVPIGFITWWAGTILGVPSGWRLCDGDNGTPNLLDKFVVGAAGTYIVGASGGTVEHVHDFTSNNHMHFVDFGDDIQGGPGVPTSSTMDVATGTTSSENNVPSYYALAYVMYIGPES